MRYDATLKKLFQNPPARLLSIALGRPVTVRRSLPTEMISVSNLQPDVLLETEDGDLLHVELQSYAMEDFAERNLLYLALVLRDYRRPPTQLVFWVGAGKTVGVRSGLDFHPQLSYRYRLIDVRQLDGDALLQDGSLEESLFAILCRLSDAGAAVSQILARIARLRSAEARREALTELLILSGLRGLKDLVNSKADRMPLSFDIHENEFLEEVFQEGRVESLRRSLVRLAEQRFGPLPTDAAARIGSAAPKLLEQWLDRVLAAGSIDELLS